MEGGRWEVWGCGGGYSCRGIYPMPGAETQTLQRLTEAEKDREKEMSGGERQMMGLMETWWHTQSQTPGFNGAG